MDSEAQTTTGAPERPAEPVLWFAFRSGELLVVEGDEVLVPKVRSVEELGLEAAFAYEVGVLGRYRCWAAALEGDAEAPGGMAFRDLRSLLVSLDEDFFLVAGRAKQVVDWHVMHRFCGRCGARTGPGPENLAKRCPDCGMVYHPRISPAAIVLVRRGDDEILLARSPGFPKGLYSILAGFAEPGESLEETVRREVREETGIEVENVRYFGSQPWPFPDSLMVGFVADYASGELDPDPEELEDAGWYRRDALPNRPPKLSIARRMIDAFVGESL
jgi:NAD+ diphosphatase